MRSGHLRKIGWAVMAGLATLIAVYSLSVLVWPPLGAPFLRERFTTMPLAVIVHLFAAAVALLLGPLQLNARLRTRSWFRHRWLGRAYVIAVCCGGAAGFALATVSEGGLPAHAGFGLLAVLWVGTTGAGYSRIRRGDRAAHREWMIRSYALALAAVTLRVYLPLSQIAGLPFEPAYQTISWLCWVPNLVVAEWVVLRSGRGRGVPIEPRAAGAL